MNKNKRNLCILCLCVMLFCILFKLYSGNNLLVERYVENFELGEGENNGLGEGCDTIDDILAYFNDIESNVGKLSFGDNLGNDGDFVYTINADFNLESIDLNVTPHTHGIHSYDVDCNSIEGEIEGENELNHCYYKVIGKDIGNSNLVKGLLNDITTINTRIDKINDNISDRLECILSLANNLNEYLGNHELNNTDVDEVIQDLFNGTGLDICNEIIKKIDDYKKFINNDHNNKLLNLITIQQDSTMSTTSANNTLMDNIGKQLITSLESFTKDISWNNLLNKIKDNFEDDIDENKKMLRINIHIKSIIDDINKFYESLGGNSVHISNNSSLNDHISTLEDAMKKNGITYSSIKDTMKKYFSETFIKTTDSESKEYIVYNEISQDIKKITNIVYEINNILTECNVKKIEIENKIQTVNNQLATNIAQLGSGAYAGNIGSIVYDKCFNHDGKSKDDVCINYLKDNVYGPGLKDPGCVVQCSVKDNMGNCLVVDEDSVNLYANIYGDAPMKIHTHPHTHGEEGWGGVIPSEGSTEGTTIMVNPVIQSKITELENKISELDKLIGELRNKYTDYTQETLNLEGDALASAQNSIITVIDGIIPVSNEKFEYLKDIKKLLETDANNLQGDALDANKNKVIQIDTKMDKLGKEIADYTYTKNELQAVIKEQFTTIEPFVGSMYATF